MISLSHLNRFIFFQSILLFLTFGSINAEDKPADIWKNNSENTESNEADDNENIKIESPILSDGKDKIEIKINENKIESNDRAVIGIFDPAENNLNLEMWSKTDGLEIKKVLNRINKLKLSKLSEDLLFQILFTNAYSPQNNLNAKEFLNIKVDWLINKNRIEDLEILLKSNPEVGQNPKAIKFLINEYLSSADIKSACEKTNFIDLKVKNIYLEKFRIYCLIYNDQKSDAQLIFDLLLEGGFKDKFFEDKTNFLLGINPSASQKIVDNNLLNFYLSYITNDNFKYFPNEKTNKYIWRYLSAANLIEVNNLENEDIILKYEQAAQENSFKKDEIFKIYLKMNFNFNQLVNSSEIYKNLPNYKARGLIYQSVLLTDDIEKKISLAFLLKDLFINDQILNVYSKELSNILEEIEEEQIPDNYLEAVNQNILKNINKNIKFNNEILHRSKVIKHFLEKNAKISRTEKDFKSVYKKIKKNKKYFISIKDIVVLESLVADGISIPSDLEYTSLSSQLTVPKNLYDLAKDNQIGLVMLKIVEIIGEDSISDLDPETIFFLNRILNELNLKKIRNNILSAALPAKI